MSGSLDVLFLKIGLGVFILGLVALSAGEYFRSRNFWVCRNMIRDVRRGAGDYLDETYYNTILLRYWWCWDYAKIKKWIQTRA